MLIVLFLFFSNQDKKNKQGRETPEHPTSPRKKKKEKEKEATPEPETSEKKTKKKKKKKKLKNEEDDDAQANTRVRFFCNLLINNLIYIFYPVSAFEEISLLKCIIILDTRRFL